MSDWKIFRGDGKPHDRITQLPPPPPWRDFKKERRYKRGATFQARFHEIELVNAALYLRRPIFVTGPPGSGKSSLADAIAWELQLGDVLEWPINSRSTLADGLYRYDAIARVRDLQASQSGISGDSVDRSEPVEGIGRYITLGALGTALLPSPKPRVLLIDEIDKADIDLPNDLLHIFEEGRYEIPELRRIAGEQPRVRVMPADGRSENDKVEIEHGIIQCDAFPLVVLTSNGERELPPAFLRRCLRLSIPAPGEEDLQRIVRAHLKDTDLGEMGVLLKTFLEKRDEEQRVMATDQLLNAVFLVTQGRAPRKEERDRVLEIIFQELGQV